MNHGLDYCAVLLSKMLVSGGLERLGPYSSDGLLNFLLPSFSSHASLLIEST